MEAEVKNWLDEEMADFNRQVRAFNKKIYTQMYSVMAGAVIVLVGIGLMSGAPMQRVLTFHLPIGLGVAVLSFLIYMLQISKSSIQVVRKKYEKALPEFLAGHTDGSAFARNLRIGSRGVLDYMHTVTDKFPMRFMVSPEYLVYCRDGQPLFVRVSEIKSVEYASEDRMKLHAGSANVRVNVNQGVTAFYVNYVDGVRGADGNPFDRFYFDTNEQLQEAVGLLQKYCPKVKELWV